ncbi:hypothetical protein KSF_005480 [Reticulibacter mediterranei]|uniref:Uncharacterized protein n=1 Tax=Reticulibacter mediterranei TaxID=2778369 RepID=A0A8J3IDL3_9CHLR|nr:hypothetical protein KSF_005480 [Reticulibacter mediterranei]
MGDKTASYSNIGDFTRWRDPQAYLSRCIELGKGVIADNRLLINLINCTANEIAQRVEACNKAICSSVNPTFLANTSLASHSYAQLVRYAVRRMMTSRS